MLIKKGVDISFAQGLDTKTDPKRVQMGNFLQLENAVFNRGAQLTKRNGYGSLTSLPDSSYTYLTTFNNALTAIGSKIAAYNTGNAKWVTKGAIQPVSLNTLPLIRNNLNQTTCDSAVSANGLVCTAYIENNNGTLTNKYVIADATTGQNIIAPAVIPVSSGTVSGGMRVFYLGNNFIIVFTNTITAVTHLQYVAISSNTPTNVSANTDIAAAYQVETGLSWDGFVANNNLYLAYYISSPGNAIKVTYLTSTLLLTSPYTYNGGVANLMSVTADTSNAASPVIYVTFYATGTTTATTIAFNSTLFPLTTAQTLWNTGTYLNITSAAQNGVLTVFGEVQNAYSYDGAIPSNYINAVTFTLATTTVSSAFKPVRSVGLASKAFIVGGTIYFLAAFQSPYQPSYFLINGSTSLQSAPVIVAKLAYQNGGGYLTKGLPNVSIVGSTTAYIPYLYKDLIQAVNKGTALSSGTQTAGIYSQTGINLSSLTFTTSDLDTAEIANDLHLGGGFLWMYDGYLPVEHNFLVYVDADTTTPANMATWSAVGGSIKAQPDGATNTNAYYYQFTYEWTDNQGNAYKSAPSIPIPVTTTGNLATGSVTLNIPTLRLTMKTANPVKIVVYRWSVAQQIYYQTTSITAPILNDTTVDSITWVDTNNDTTILGNNILYTTGGVLEDVNAPACDVLALFDTRLWLVDSEDRNLLWFSKQVIEATPVEMSDLLTLYVPPVIATEQPTGPILTLAPMDDKLIIGKRNALYYINGNGPDNTGANNQYSEPVFITSSVGSINQKSIVLIPQGMMFQSDKGIWILDRGLGVSYIGAPVEAYTSMATVNSAVNIPAENQVRFTLSSGITLMYDYFYGQWGTFTGVPAVSSTIFQQMHTFINSKGLVYQETAGAYVDGSNPVEMMFQTAWIRLGDLQSYQRAYFFYLLGTYISPHKLQIQIAYDYDTAPSQSMVISPTNYSTPYGSGLSQSPYGQGNVYGGPKASEQWRVFMQNQRCMAIQITLKEIFDSSFGTLPGAGLTLSGLNMVLAFKKDYRPQSNASSIG